MRFYYLLNLQHVFLFVLPTLLFILIFGLALGYTHFWTPRAKRRESSVVHGYADGIEGRNAPFPLAMLLIIVGVALWAFFYIWMYGVMGAKI